MSRSADSRPRALAWALLGADEWRPMPLREAASRTFGRPTAYFVEVVEEVLRAYPTPPRQRPDDLAELLATSEAFATLIGELRLAGAPLRVRAIPAVPGAMGIRRWPVPAVADLPELAALLEVPAEQLIWMADERGMQRRTPDGPLHLYRHRWLPRAGAVPRLLEVPTPLQRAVLRRVNRRILDLVPHHEAAHGHRRDRSAITGAAPHIGRPVVIGMDLRSFFASVSRARVSGIFGQLGYPEPVCRLLSSLATHRVPVQVLAQMPGGGDSSARHRMRAYLRYGHLPQGAPTSPALANLACFRLDRRLAGYARSSNLRYTRYADDLTFSGDPRSAPAVIAAVSRIVESERFAVNPAKTRIQRSGRRQEVTGLVTNDVLRAPRRYVDQLRAVLHEARTNGPAAANRQQHPDFAAHLLGRIAWVAATDPRRAARLRAEFDRIDWAR